MERSRNEQWIEINQSQPTDVAFWTRWRKRRKPVFSERSCEVYSIVIVISIACVIIIAFIIIVIVIIVIVIVIVIIIIIILLLLL